MSPCLSSSSFSCPNIQDIEKPDKDDWGTGLDAMHAALALERKVNKSLLDLHKVAGDHNDYQVRSLYRPKEFVYCIRHCRQVWLCVLSWLFVSLP